MSLAELLIPGRDDDGLKSLRSVHTDGGLEQRAVVENVKYIGVSHLSVEIWFQDGSAVRITSKDFLNGLNIEKR